MREVMFRGKPVCEYSEIDEEFKEDFKENIKDGFIYGYLIGKDVIVGEIWTGYRLAASRRSGSTDGGEEQV